MKKKNTLPFNKFYRYATDDLKIGVDAALELAERAEDIFQDGFVTEETLNDETEDAYGSGFDEGKEEGEIEGYSDCKEEVAALLDENIREFQRMDGSRTFKVSSVIATIESIKRQIKRL